MDVSLETIIDTLSWYKTWLLNGSRHIRAKQKLLKKPRRVYRTSWGRPWTKSHLHWQFLGIWRSLCKSFLESLCVDTTQIGNEWHCLRERYAELRKEHLQYCCNQVWMKNGGQIPWNATAICKTFRIICLMGRHHVKGGSEYHLTDQVSRLEYHPISAKDLSRLHQFGLKVLPGTFLGYALYAGVNLERRHNGRRHWRFGGHGRIWTLRPKAQLQRKC